MIGNQIASTVNMGQDNDDDGRDRDTDKMVSNIPIKKEVDPRRVDDIGTASLRDLTTPNAQPSSQSGSGSDTNQVSTIGTTRELPRVSKFADEEADKNSSSLGNVESGAMKSTLSVKPTISPPAKTAIEDKKNIDQDNDLSNEANLPKNEELLETDKNNTLPETTSIEPEIKTSPSPDLAKKRREVAIKILAKLCGKLGKADQPKNLENAIANCLVLIADYGRLMSGDRQEKITKTENKIDQEEQLEQAKKASELFQKIQPEKNNVTKPAEEIVASKQDTEIISGLGDSKKSIGTAEETESEKQVLGRELSGWLSMAKKLGYTDKEEVTNLIEEKDEDFQNILDTFREEKGINDTTDQAALHVFLANRASAPKQPASEKVTPPSTTPDDSTLKGGMTVDNLKSNK